LAATTRATEQRTSEFGDQHLANAAWALATMHQSYGKLSQEMARALEGGEASSASRTFREHGLGICNDELVVREAIGSDGQGGGAKFSEFNVQKLANTAWAFKKIR